MPKRKTPESAEYVGYRHPPKGTRFKAGDCATAMPYTAFADYRAEFGFH